MLPDKQKDSRVQYFPVELRISVGDWAALAPVKLYLITFFFIVVHVARLIEIIIVKFLT